MTGEVKDYIIVQEARIAKLQSGGGSGGTITVDSSLSISGGKNILASTGTGSQIATAANQKIGFWGVTPVVQFATTGETAGHSAVGGTNVNASDTFTGNFGTRAYTLNDIVKALKTAGIMDKDT